MIIARKPFKEITLSLEHQSKSVVKLESRLKKTKFHLESIELRLKLELDK